MSTLPLPAVFGVLCASFLPAMPQGPKSPARVSFSRDVRPILADRCYHCHGPDAERQKAKLRLDRPDGPTGAYRERKGRAAIQPGDPDGSALWERISSDDPKVVMPPPDSHKQALSEQEREIIRRWILEGAEYEQHWAFVAPSRTELPATADAWSRGDIDRFVLARMRSEGLSPTGEADRRTLIRRLSFDLTGLPPTRDEIRDFLTDGSPSAYATLVDRLLAKPQFGEHMARYWLDLVRFADTNGIHHDHYREMSPYRDWVIRSFRDNMPFDEFVRDQIAGDLHAEPTTDQKIASGFNRLHLIIDVGTALPEESLVRNVIDRVSAVGTAFMGLTLGCAVCHDHKYDPVPQRDFYRMFAFFNNIDAKPETGGRRGTDFKRGLQPPFVNLPDAAQASALAEREAELRLARDVVDFLKAKEKAAKPKSKPVEPASPAKDDEADRESKAKVAKGDDAERAEPKPFSEAAKKALGAELARAQKRVKTLTSGRDKVLLDVPGAMVMKERAEARPAHILIRGAYDNPGDEVQRGTPAFLPPLALDDDEAQPTRMDLARWLIDPQHPLTARVAVNRFWQQVFGVGLVKTAEDFGLQGESPSHPELLDHLAMSFVESGWDVKALVRRMVMSATYRQSSVASAEAYAKDPENRLLARGSRYRMDAEMVRDQILATSGLLNRKMFGKSVKPPQPEGVWKAVTLPSSFPRVYRADSGDKIYRRSLYTFWKRGLPPPQMTLLNAPTREFCTARRERTNTPLQALLLWNEPEYLKAARHLAHAVLASDEPNAEARLRVIYETITSHVPDADETAALLGSLADLKASFGDQPEQVTALCEGVELSSGLDACDLAAWTLVTSTIYHLDITKTRQ